MDEGLQQIQSHAAPRPFATARRVPVELRRSPPAFPSLLDMLGPWPWYILVLEAIGAVAFVLVYLPYALRDSLRGQGRSGEASSAG